MHYVLHNLLHISLSLFICMSEERRHSTRRTKHCAVLYRNLLHYSVTAETNKHITCFCFGCLLAKSRVQQLCGVETDAFAKTIWERATQR
jgi:hypothetical protein